jgi:hypothetical protein
MSDYNEDEAGAALKAARESWLTLEAMSRAALAAFDPSALAGFLAAAVSAQTLDLHAPPPKPAPEKIAEFGAMLVVVNLAPDDLRMAGLRAMRGDDPDLLAEVEKRARALLRLWASMQQAAAERAQAAEGPEELETIA